MLFALAFVRLLYLHIRLTMILQKEEETIRGKKE